MCDAVIAIALTLLAIVGTTIFNLEALGVVARFSRSSWHPRIHVPGVLTLVICAHPIGIGGYALIYWIADVQLNIGWSIFPSRSRLPILRDLAFLFLQNNSSNPTGFFKIPPNRVLELGLQVRI